MQSTLERIGYTYRCIMLSGLLSLVLRHLGCLLLQQLFMTDYLFFYDYFTTNSTLISVQYVKQ